MTPPNSGSCGRFSAWRVSASSLSAQQDLAEQLAVPVRRCSVGVPARDTRPAPWMTELRKDIAAWLDKNGGIMTVNELAATC